MPLHSSRKVWPFRSLLLIVATGLGLSTRVTLGEDLDGAMDQFAGRIKQLLDGEHETALALNQFTAPARLAANGSSGIRKALQEGLKRRGIEVKKSARLEITGDYREVEDPGDGKTVVRIVGRVVDQDTGRPVSECEVKVDNVTAIAALVGATMELPPTPVREDRERSIRDGIRRPNGHVASSRISAGPGSSFALEILVGPTLAADAKLKPREALIDEGQAYMNIRTSERYAIKLINDAPFDVAVTLTIDGLNLFTFSDNPAYRYVIVPQHSSGFIGGWFRSTGESERFVVTEYARSAAASRSLSPSAELGVITACFAAAWPPRGNPPPDEGMEGRSAAATGRGPLFKTKYTEVERRTGRLRASISVRYTKENEPKEALHP